MALHFFGFANFWLVKLAKISLANGTFQKLGLSNWTKPLDTNEIEKTTW